MSTAAYAFDNTGFIASPSIYGFGKTAEYLKDLFERSFKESFLTSFTFSSNYKSLIANLNEVCYEAIDENWDGYNAKPLNIWSYIKSIKFIILLPTSFPAPEISVDPDGEISFEWFVKPRYIFTVSVSPYNKISYAGLIGINSVKGVESFEDELPRLILDNLIRLYSHEG